MPEDLSRPNDPPSRFRATWDALARVEARRQGRYVPPPAQNAAVPKRVKPSLLPDPSSAAKSEPRPRGRHPLVGVYATFQRGGITFRGRIIGVASDERRLSAWSFASDTLRQIDPRAWTIAIEHEGGDE